MSIRKTLLAAAILLTPLAAQNKPDFTGAWKLKPGDGGEGPAEVVLRIEHAEPSFKCTATGRSSRGEPFSETYEFTTDGKSGEAGSRPVASGHWESEVLVVRFLVRGNEIARSTLRLEAGGQRTAREVAFKGRAPLREVYEKR
jgi:hypothetical protein